MDIGETIAHELFKEDLKRVIRCNANLSEGQKQYMCNNIDKAAKCADYCVDMIRRTGSQSRYSNRWFHL